MKKSVKILLVLSIGGVLVYTVYAVSVLSARIRRIEERLGGAEKVACDEKETVERVRRSVVRIIGEGEGSGFVVRGDGFILTNYHVVEGEPGPKVILPDNTFETGKVLAVDTKSDLAVIKISRQLPSVSWANLGRLRPAQELLSIGFPFGGDLAGEASVSRGLLSGRRKFKDTGTEYIQTDAVLSSGVSGGPMVDICGEVVGINTMSREGWGLAVSADFIRNKLREMAVSSESRKDVPKILFEPEKSALEAVRAFYNYLKVRRLEEAFGLLSDNFVKGYDFEYWQKGYKPLLDTTILGIHPDADVENRIRAKLATKDFVDDEIVYKFFQGYWDVKQVDGKGLLWDPDIYQVMEPDVLWFWDAT